MTSTKTRFNSSLPCAENGRRRLTARQATSPVMSRKYSPSSAIERSTSACPTLPNAGPIAVGIHPTDFAPACAIRVSTFVFANGIGVERI